MLTLPEAIAAIKSLDTEPDIIEQACNSVLGTAGEQLSNIDELSEHIFRTYNPLVSDKGDLMGACAILAGKLAGALHKPDKARELLAGLDKLLVQSFTEAATVRIHRQFERNPRAALASLMAMATNIASEDSKS